MGAGVPPHQRQEIHEDLLMMGFSPNQIKRKEPQAYHVDRIPEYYTETFLHYGSAGLNVAGRLRTMLKLLI